jgi:Secretion system C-terminal sorting domain
MAVLMINSFKKLLSGKKISIAALTFLFTPVSFSQIPTNGLQLWLKSDAGIVHNDYNVSSWQDQSGNGYNAIQSNADRQPFLGFDQLIGKPVLAFDGTNDKLGFTGSITMTQLSFFIVMKQYQGATTPDEEVPITFGGIDMNLGKQYFFVTRDPIVSDPDNHIAVGFSPDYSALASSNYIATYGEWKYYTIVTNHTIWNTKIRWNGIDATISHIGSNASLSVPLGDSLGRGGGIGGADNVPEGTLAARCDIAELILYNRVVSDSEVLVIEGYLSQKYNFITGVNDLAQNIMPDKFILSQNFPNPFNPSTTIKYSIPISGFVTLKVYDVLGKEVATLVNEEKPAGNHEVTFNAANLSSGVYLYTLQAGSYTQTKKLILMK